MPDEYALHRRKMKTRKYLARRDGRIRPSHPSERGSSTAQYARGQIKFRTAQHLWHCDDCSGGGWRGCVSERFSKGRKQRTEAKDFFFTIFIF